MKAFQLGERNGADAPIEAILPDPVAAPGEAIVAPRLVSLISRDLQLLRGSYGGEQPSDRVPMSEGVGMVLAVGEGVTQVKPGDRVVCGHFATWLDGYFRAEIFGHDIGITHNGWLAEKVALPAAALIRVPDSLADRNVAALASAGLTAWNALVEVGRVNAKSTVLCLGTGGVSLAALQIAKAHGARVVITSSSDEKLEIARTLGADLTVNYRANPQWATEVLAQTGNHGADIVIETGGQDTLGQSIAAAAVNGHIIIIGVTLGTAQAIPDYVSLIGKNLTIRGIANGSRAMFIDLLRFLEANKIETIVSRTFPFHAAADAYGHFASAKHIGKVMIEFAT